MGLFDIFRKTNKVNVADVVNFELGNYQQKYYEECKYIWKNLVPKSGQANNLQGEMLRQIEKLRCEAQDNGNINWCDDFNYFCDFLKEQLGKSGTIDDDTRKKVMLSLDKIKYNGQYADKYNNGIISDNELDIEKLACTVDNLYDIVADAIGDFYINNREHIPYEINPNINH